MSDLVLNAFGLRHHPFTVDIDVDGLYGFQSFQQGALRMEQAARQKGSILVVAEPGTGKTALLRSVVKRLASSSFSIRARLLVMVITYCWLVTAPAMFLFSSASIERFI